MGRVLPSGRVFGEAVGLPNVDYAAREKFGGRLQEVIESPVTDLAVAGISRIKDELDYRDRLNAEQQRQAAAQAEVQGLERQREGFEQAQQRAMTLGLPPGSTYQDLLSAQEAMVEEGLGSPQAEGTPGRLRRTMLFESTPERAIGFDVDARLAAIGERTVANQEEFDQLMLEKARRGLGQEERAIISPLPTPPTVSREEVVEVMQGTKGTILEDYTPDDIRQLIAEVRGIPGVAGGQSWRQGKRRPGDKGYDELGLVQKFMEEKGWYERPYRGQQPPGRARWSGKRTADTINRLESMLTVAKEAKASPEAQTPERQALLDEKIAEIEAAIEGLGPQLEARFVPRTLADFRMVAKDLEHRILAAESPEEKEALGQRLLQTMQTARGAVDMPSEDVFEAVTGAAGKRAQKTIFEDLSVVDKEFIKQMREEAKEKRAISRDERAEAAAKRAERGEERAIAAADRAAGASERAEEKHTEWKRKLNKMSSGLRSRGRAKAADIADYAHNYADNYHKWKGGEIDDAAWKKLAGPLAEAEPGTMASRAAKLGGLRGKEITVVRDFADNLLAREKERRAVEVAKEKAEKAKEKADAARVMRAQKASIQNDIDYAEDRMVTRATYEGWKKRIREITEGLSGLATEKKKREAKEERAGIQRSVDFYHDMQMALDGHRQRLANLLAGGEYELLSVDR